MSLIVLSRAWYLMPSTRSALDPSNTFNFLASSGPVPGLPTGTFLRSGKDLWRIWCELDMTWTYINNVLAGEGARANNKALAAGLFDSQSLDVSLGDCGQRR